MTACQPALVPVARPTPAVLTVQRTPALQTLDETFRDCIREQDNAGLVLLDTQAASLDPARSPAPAAIALRWGPSGSKSYIAVVGQEELVVVANPQNPLKSISLPDLQAIYGGKLRAWPQSDPSIEVQPWVYLPGDDAQAVFESSILKGGTASARVARLAPDPAAMRDAVAGDPAAVGFLPRRWVNQTVKEMPVEGLDSASLRQPVLALTKMAPGGMEKSWLICVQERLPK